MIRLAFIGTLSLILTACASVRSQQAAPDSSLLGVQTAPLGRVCRVVPLPEELPAAGVLVDSAALHAALIELQEDRTMAPQGHALLSLAYDRFGINVRRTVVDHDLPAVVADSVQKLVFAHRQEVPAGEEWGLRLRIDLGEEIAMRVGRQEFCLPRVRDRGITSPTADQLPATGVQTPPAVNLWERTGRGMREEVVWVRVFLDPQGRVEGAQIERGLLTGMAEAQVFQHVGAMHFEPALQDGIPVSGSLVLPLTIRQR